MTQPGVRHPFMLVVLAGASLWLAACGFTQVADSHPLRIPCTEEAVQVYFLRDDPGFIGIEGNAFEIYLADRSLLSLAKGDYTLACIRPYAGTVLVASTTMMNRGGVASHAMVTASAELDLTAPGPRFVAFRRHAAGRGEGFRYLPVVLDAGQARLLARGLKSVGEARDHPL